MMLDLVGSDTNVTQHLGTEVNHQVPRRKRYVAVANHVRQGGRAQRLARRGPLRDAEVGIEKNTSSDAGLFWEDLT